MSYNPDQLSWLPRPEDYPEYKLMIESTELSLRWDNTLIRRFVVGDGVFDHVLHVPSEGQALAIFLTAKEITEAIPYLEDNQYPCRTDPLPDEAVQDFYATVQGRRLGDFVDETER
jgi:hypothetical protein